MNYRPIILFFAVVVVGLFLTRNCQQQSGKSEQLPTPADTSETNRQNQRAADSLARIAHAAEVAEWKRKYTALDSVSRVRAYVDSLAVVKARQSADQYRKTPTLANCHHALLDCEHENRTKAAVIDVQKQQIATAADRAKLDSAEIRRSWAATDSASEGWRKAAAGWKAEETALAKEKAKRFSIGLQAGYGIGKSGLTPYVGVGLQYQILRF